MKLKITLTLIIVLNTFVSANAQVVETDNVKSSLTIENKDTVAWVYGGALNLGVNEGLLHNWPAGGEAVSLTVNVLANLWLNRLDHNRVWSNNLDFTYSLFYAQSNNFRPRKIDDRIDFTSKYGFRLDSTNFYFTSLFNFKSQISNGYDYDRENYDSFATSKFLSPGYFTLASGLEYRRGSILSLFLSPVAARLTLAAKEQTLSTPQGAFGVKNGETHRLELGAYFSGRLQVDLSKTFTYKTRVDLYSNYLAKNTKDSVGNIIKKDNPGHIDVLWDNILSIKVAKFFSIIIAATAIYDNDIPYNRFTKDEAGNKVLKDEPAPWLGWWQLKQTFTFGFTYKI